MKLPRTLLGTCGALAALLLAGCSDETTCPAADQRLCAGVCVAVQSDDANCGACGNACAAGSACQSGACVDCALGGCTPDVVAACFNTDELRLATSSLVPTGGSLALEDGPVALARDGATLYAVNNLEHSVSVVSLGDAPTVARRFTLPGTPSGFGDLQQAAVRNGVLWIINSAAATLVGVDPSTGAAVDQIALTSTPFAFPQGLDFVGSKAYVSLNGTNEVAVVDLSAVPGHVATTIDVSGLAVAGAAAMPARVRAVGNRVYVTLNHLSPTTFAPVAGANGRLAVIDAGTGALDATTPMLDLGPGCLNPSDLAVDGAGWLWVTCGYYDFFGTRLVQGGGFMPVNPTGTPVPEERVETAQAPASLAFCDGVAYAGDVASGTLLRFDPRSRRVSTAGICPANISGNAWAADVECAR